MKARSLRGEVKVSPSARTLNLLRRRGWTCDVVERFIAAAGIRKDWGGFADILAVNPSERRLLLVQATSLANVAARLTKARSKPALAAWLRAGGAFEVWGWALVGGRWQVKRVEVHPGDLATVTVEQPPRRRRLRHGERQGLLFSDA